MGLRMRYVLWPSVGRITYSQFRMMPRSERRYSTRFFGTCLLHEINPQAWLTDVLERIPKYSAKRVHELLPHRWKLAQQKPLRKAA